MVQCWGLGFRAERLGYRDVLADWYGVLPALTSTPEDLALRRPQGTLHI